ncbi:hypothetical protein CSAL01_06677, partial [Colletotrichum salicis]
MTKFLLTELIHGLSTLSQSSMMANAGSFATGIGGSCLSSPVPKLLIGIFNHQVDKTLNIENIAREATQAGVMAWRAAQRRQWQGLQMTESETEAESPHKLQSLIEKLPGLVGSIDWDVPVGDGVTAGAEWIGSVKWPLTATAPSIAAGVAATASHLIARGYFLFYEVCGNAISNGCDTTAIFSFSEIGRVGSEAFDAPRDWESAVATLDQERASGRVKAGLLQQNPEGIESCGVYKGSPVHAFLYTTPRPTIKAFRFLGPDKGLVLQDIPNPSPGPEQALISVKAAGLYHSDTHVLHGDGAAWMCALPVTFGHEVSGIITELGNYAATSFNVGDRFAVACVGHPIQERKFEEALGVGCDG